MDPQQLKVSIRIKKSNWLQSGFFNIVNQLKTKWYYQKGLCLFNVETAG